jgi:hypothetical protein
MTPRRYAPADDQPRRRHDRLRAVPPAKEEQARARLSLRFRYIWPHWRRLASPQVISLISTSISLAPFHEVAVDDAPRVPRQRSAGLSFCS